ncbi:RHOMBOID-like protein 1 isoform X2 [Arachis stenosperma]|uniref:RHOMBOID-like protein 1 isoform X2 n=1 Tax=Arachis stenosperma TaxID=217475 RepID=UPI0025AB7BBB|nr:RHOMBOID-like protein 1 isoform X2 [Arachis stenosperma]
MTPPSIMGRGRAPQFLRATAREPRRRVPPPHPQMLPRATARTVSLVCSGGGSHGWYRALWWLTLSCSSSQCTLMIVRNICSVVRVLQAFSAGSLFSHLRKTLSLALLHTLRIGFLYVISGFGGSLLSALFIQSGISVGASGALFGLLGGMLSEILINWTIYANKVAALLTLIVITLINLAVGILPHVDNFAHIGGFLSGFFLGFVFLIRPQFKWIVQRNSPSAPSSLKNRHKPYQYILWIISFLLLTSGYIIGLIFLLRGVNLNDHCSWCRYLSCVPTSLWRCDAKQVYCETSQIGNRLNITCLSNGRSELVDMPNVGFPSPLELCSQLCR